MNALSRACLVTVVACAASATLGGVLLGQSDSTAPTKAPSPPQAMHLRIVFFTPSDIEPPASAKLRMKEIADFTQDFFKRWMTHWGYPPAVPLAIERDAAGDPKVLYVKGKHTKASGKYDKLGFGKEISSTAREKYNIAQGPDVWWFFLYKGPETGWGRGGGNVRTGGWSNAAYFDLPGTVETGDDLGGGFLRDIKLKGCIHEFGHALGLPHLGPRDGDDAGNTLMGPINTAFERFSLKKKEPRVYLSEAAAAMLWKHPLFSGTSKNHTLVPQVTLNAFAATHDKAKKVLKVTGTLQSKGTAHSVVIANESKQTRSPYWRKTFVGRVNGDGEFEVVIDEFDASDGLLRLVFCFNNGAITGGGKALGFDASGIEKPYRFDNGEFVFEAAE